MCVRVHVREHVYVCECECVSEECEDCESVSVCVRTVCSASEMFRRP